MPFGFCVADCNAGFLDMSEKTRLGGIGGRDLEVRYSGESVLQVPGAAVIEFLLSVFRLLGTGRKRLGVWTM